MKTDEEIEKLGRKESIEKYDQIHQDFIDGHSLGYKSSQAEIVEIRTAFADYVKSEGCGCCGSKDAHDEASERLGKLLDVEKYSDGIGFNFYAYATNKKSQS